MANFLEQLSQGLRIAGTALSPQAFQADVRKQEQLQSLRAQREEMLMQAATQAVQNGALSPDKFQMLKQQRRWNIPDLGPNVQTQKNIYDVNKDMATTQEQAQSRSAYEQAIAQYEQTAKYEPPPEIANDPARREVWGKRTLVDDYMRRAEIATQFRQDDEARRWRDLAQTEISAQRLIQERGGASTQYERALTTLQELQLKQERGEPLDRAEQLQAESARAILQQQRMGIDPATNQPYYVQPLTVPQSITVGGGPARQAGVLPPLTSGRKPLDAGTEKEFQKIGDGRSQLLAIIAGFKPEYGGFVSDIVGKGAIEGGRRGILPEYTDMSQWWQMYEQWITDIRAEKFGLTLTGHELEAMRQYRITTRDTKETIQKNLTRQLKIVDNAIQRRLGAVSQSGQNVKQAEELLGPSTAPAYEDEIPIPAPLNWTDEDEARLKQLEERKRAP